MKTDLHRRLSAFEEATPPKLRSAVSGTLAGLPRRRLGIPIRRLCAVAVALALCGILAASPLGALALQALGNLFDFFARDDAALEPIARQAQVAQHTPLPIVEGDTDALASVDRIYFDGDHLYLTYVLWGGAQQVADFEIGEAREGFAPLQSGLLPMLQGDTPKAQASIGRFYEAFRQGEAAGLYVKTISRKDHILAGDGTDLPWETMREETLDGHYMEYIAFEALPASFDALEWIDLTLSFTIQEAWYWFDGHTLYAKQTQGGAYSLTAGAPRVVPDKP